MGAVSGIRRSSQALWRGRGSGVLGLRRPLDCDASLAMTVFGAACGRPGIGDRTAASRAARAAKRRPMRCTRCQIRMRNGPMMLPRPVRRCASAWWLSARCRLSRMKMRWSAGEEGRVAFTNRHKSQLTTCGQAAFAGGRLFGTARIGFATGGTRLKNPRWPPASSGQIRRPRAAGGAVRLCGV